MVDKEILERLGLDETEFKDLCEKQASFSGSLSPSQLRVAQSSTLSKKAAAECLGPNVTVEDLQQLLDKFTPTGAVVTCNWCSPRPPGVKP